MQKRFTGFANRFTLFALVAISAASVIGTGCGKAGGFGVQQSDSTWSRNLDDPVPGIDSASVTNVKLHSGKAEGAFVIWSDLGRGCRGSGQSNVRGASFTGRHLGDDGKELEFQAQASAGQPPSVTIGGRHFNLADGGLFLISMRADAPEVKQLKVDLQDFPKGMDAIVRFADQHPDIRAFFEERHSDKPLAESPEEAATPSSPRVTAEKAP